MVWRPGREKLPKAADENLQQEASADMCEADNIDKLARRMNENTTSNCVPFEKK